MQVLLYNYAINRPTKFIMAAFVCSQIFAFSKVFENLNVIFCSYRNFYATLISLFSFHSSILNM